MQLTNNKFLYRSIIFLIFLACDKDETPPIFGNPLPNPPGLTNELNLQSDSGEKIDEVRLTWNDLGTAVLTDHSSITQNQIIPSGNYYDFSGMQPGEFRDISIQISITADSTYEDSIQIFTRAIYPVSSFEFEVDAIKVGEGEWNSWDPYTDLGNGIWDEGEPFVDEKNSIWDEGETYADLGNGIWDEGEPFVDKKNGEWDPGETFEDDGNGQWDPGETFTDLGNGIWDEGETFTDLGNGMWDPGEPFVDEKNGEWDEGEIFTDSGNGMWDEGEPFIDQDTIKYHRNLIWSPTLESQGNYYIYRSTIPSNLLCSTCKIDNLTLLSESTYIDSSSVVIDEPSEDTFYYMVQVSIDNFTRNSFIYNYTGFDPVGPITGGTVSTDKIEFITITWNPISTDNLYQYEIWRFKGQPDQGNDTLLVAIIPNITPNLGINHFMDRGDEFMDGTTYYYSVKVVDINGRKPYSDFIEGFSYPW